MMSSTSTTHHLLTHLTCTLASTSATDTIHQCSPPVLSLCRRDAAVAIALAHEKLHVFPFNKVETCWRRAYEEASLWRVCELLRDITDQGVFDGDGDYEGPGTKHAGHEWVDQVVEILDRAWIMTGCAGRGETVRWMLDELEKYVEDQGRDALQAEMRKGQSGEEGPPSRKRRRLELPLPKHDVEQDGLGEGSNDNVANEYSLEQPTYEGTSPRRSPAHHTPSRKIPTTFPSTSPRLPHMHHPIPRLPNPSLQSFQAHMHTARTPVILTNSIAHWPALERWQNPQYWMRRTIGGRRLVPVELGRSYVDEGWGQKLMLYGEFVEKGLIGEGWGVELEGGDVDVDAGGGGGGDAGRSSTQGECESGGNAIGQVPGSKRRREKRKGYLAQHDLLAQIPSLRNDIAVPDYCYISPPSPPPPPPKPGTPSTAPPGATSGPINSTTTSIPPTVSNAATTNDADDAAAPTEPLLNIWLGPAQTISPCHTDPHHNILAQVVGTKYVRLFAPEEQTVEGRMYPRGREVVRTRRGEGLNDDKVGERSEEGKVENRAVNSEREHRKGSEGAVAVPASHWDGLGIVEIADGEDGVIDESGRENFHDESTKQEQEEGEEGEEEERGIDMSNTSRVDVSAFVDYNERPDEATHERRAEQLKKYPDFKHAEYVEGILEAGDCLYIPRGWWHYVQSLEVSCSVSFWWD